MKKPTLIAFVAGSLLIIFAVLPLLAGLGYALLYSLGLAGTLGKGFTLENYVQLFSRNNVIGTFVYTIILSIISLSLCIFISLLITLKFQRFFSRGIMSYLVSLPLSFPAIVGAFFFFQFLSSAGLLARIFYQAGFISSITQFPNLINDKWSIGIIATQTFLSCPFFILLFVNIYRNERINEYLHLSYTLGAPKLKAAFTVAIPVMLKKALPTLLLYFIFKLGAYEIPLLLGRSTPETISVMAVRKLQRFNLADIPQGYAVAVLYAIVVALLLIVFFKINRQLHEA
ncbi:MAG: ABC transporter permease subunit [Ferruginibacter sp.]